jgi:hypothetical protein
MQPQPGPDGTKPESPFILKFLPLMIGWFSLNVPICTGDRPGCQQHYYDVDNTFNSQSIEDGNCVSIFF